MLRKGDLIQQSIEHHPRLPDQSTCSVWGQGLRGKPQCTVLPLKLAFEKSLFLKPGEKSCANVLKT